MQTLNDVTVRSEGGDPSKTQIFHKGNQMLSVSRARIDLQPGSMTLKLDIIGGSLDMQFPTAEVDDAVDRLDHVLADHGVGLPRVELEKLYEYIFNAKELE